MLSVHLNNLGKRYNREWIFRNLNHEIKPGQKLVITGGNGSGKSTLLQVISGFITPNQGEVEYKLSGKQIDPEAIKDYISFASPYLQLIEDFTLEETVDHLLQFKPLVNGLSTENFIELIEMVSVKQKPVKQFSSGMKQRLKLGLAILSDTPVLLMDEPLSNLDQQAIDWYSMLIKTYAGERTVIVCSNAIREEYFFCDKELNVTKYK